MYFYEKYKQESAYYQPFITGACGACLGVLIVVFGPIGAGTAVFVP